MTTGTTAPGAAGVTAVEASTARALRLAVVAGGEPALRAVRAARGLAVERGVPVHIVAIVPTGEEDGVAAREADDVVRLAAVTADEVRRAVRGSGCDVVWGGWWPAGVRSAVAAAVHGAGAVVVGPAPPPRVAPHAAMAMLASVAGVPPALGMRASARLVDVVLLVDGTTAHVVGATSRMVAGGVASPVRESAEPSAREVRAARRVCAATAHRGVVTVRLEVDALGGIRLRGVGAGASGDHAALESAAGVDLVAEELRPLVGPARDCSASVPGMHAASVVLEASGEGRQGAVVEALRLVGGPGVRVDSTCVVGARAFNGPVVRLTGVGRDRDEALARLGSAVAGTMVVLHGGVVDRGRCLTAIAAARGRPVRPTAVEAGAPVAVLVAAVEAYENDVAAERDAFLASAARGRPSVSHAAGGTVDIRHRGVVHRVRVRRRGGDRYRVETDAGAEDILVDRVSAFERHVVRGGVSHRVVVGVHPAARAVEVDGFLHRAARDDATVVRATSPSVVVSLLVREGDDVKQGQPLAVLEAMKMEMAVCAPFGGRVARVHTTENVQVDPGAPLVALRSAATSHAGARVDMTPPPCAPPPDGDLEHARASLRLLRDLALGFDVDTVEARRAVAEYRTAVAGVACDDTALLSAEDDFLEAFADVTALARRVPEDATGAAEDVGSPHEHLAVYMRTVDASSRAVPQSFRDRLTRALRHLGIAGLERGPQLEEALFRVAVAHTRMSGVIPAVVAVLERRLADAERIGLAGGDRLVDVLGRLVDVGRNLSPSVADLAREVHHQAVELPRFERARADVFRTMNDHLEHLAGDPGSADHEERMRALVECPHPLHTLLTRRFPGADAATRSLMLDVLTRRYYRVRDVRDVRRECDVNLCVTTTDYHHGDRHIRAVSAFATLPDVAAVAEQAARLGARPDDGADIVLDVYALRHGPGASADQTADALRAQLDVAALMAPVRRVLVAETAAEGGWGVSVTRHFTFRRAADGRFVEDDTVRGLHPMIAERIDLWRFAEFSLERLPSVEDVYVFRAVARANPRDERLFAVAEVRDVEAVLDDAGHIERIPHLERMLDEALSAIRTFQSRRDPAERLQFNRVILHVWPPLPIDDSELHGLIHRLGPDTEGLGLEKITVKARIPDPEGVLVDTEIHLSNPLGRGVNVVRFQTPARNPLRPLDDRLMAVARMRRRGLVHAWEIVQTLTGATSDLPAGAFVEHDLDGEDAALHPVDRPFGENQANLVVGVVETTMPAYPEGMRRAIILGDPTRSLGALAEPECRRIIAAIDLAERERIPLEWFALSSGARIAMDNGTENMDWIAAVLRRIIEFTQRGGEINVVVNGINVGAQPYWNAEATMLMHTRGILVMTPDGAMVLTGKDALDYSGGVSADDNFGIGGYERVMGPNGQAQYWAPDLPAACRLLLRHYEHTYRVAGERFPRRVATIDPVDRVPGASPHPSGLGSDFTLVGDVFSPTANPQRKRPFDIRTVMASVADQDHAPLERWRGQRHAETVVVWDARLGGMPVCMLGIESRPLPRAGFVPADGPDHWTAGTLFPQSSKKAARAINAADDNRPLVVLANLSGFDGSPESMRNLQLEFGAEIGRAVVNFRGPMVFCVVSRYHGGAFVVFSSRLNEHLEIAAVEGSYASVIGGAPAAAVVFAREVAKRTREDPRVADLEARLAAAEGADRSPLRARLDSLVRAVRSEKLGEVAREFDAVHTVERALAVGSVHRIIPADTLRSYLVDALERGVRRTLAEEGRVAELAAFEAGMVHSTPET